MDDDQKHLVAKSHDYNFLVITQFFFRFLPKEHLGTTQKINLPIKSGLISTIDPLMEKSSVVV
jgi:hypothetical protein